MNTPRTILITGASRGIGQACAVALSAPHTTLVLLAQATEHLHATAQLCAQKGATTHCIAVDLSHTDALRDVVESITNTHGPIHTLINNAGVWIEEPFLSGDMAQWDRALDINLKAVVHLTRYVVQNMPPSGAVVFIASTASKRTYANGTNYCAAKHAVAGFAGALFEDLRAQQIKVCSIFPGVVNTDMHAADDSMDKTKMIQPEDVAQSVCYALSTPVHVCPTEIVLQPQRHPKCKN